MSQKRAYVMEKRERAVKRQERIAKRERRRVARAMLPSTGRMDALEFTPYEPGPTVSPVKIIQAVSLPSFSDYLKSKGIPDPTAVVVDEKTVTVKDDVLVAMGYTVIDESSSVLAAEAQLEAVQEQVDVGQAYADEMKKGVAALQKAAYDALKFVPPEGAVKKVPAAPISGMGYPNEHTPSSYLGLAHYMNHDYSASFDPKAEGEEAAKSEEEPVHLPIKVVPDSSIGDYVAFGAKKAFEAADVEADIDGDVILPGAFEPWPEDTPVVIKKVPGNVSISAVDRGTSFKFQGYGHYPPPYAPEPDVPSGSCRGPQGYAPEDPNRKKGIRPYSQKDAKMRARSKP